MQRFLFILLSLFLIGSIILNVLFIQHYHIISKVYQRIISFSSSYYVSSYSYNCPSSYVPEITLNSSHIKDEIILVIGHAYGAHRNSNILSFTSPNVVSFIKKYTENIDSIIFTGDVFKIPTAKKWQQLDRFLTEEKISYIIAPGNHDVGGNQSRHIFHENVTDRDYPQKFQSNFATLIITDTTKPIPYDWEKIDDLLKIEPKYHKLFILGHHIVNSSLQKFANRRLSKNLEKENYNKQKKSEIFKKFKEIYFISGDTGAFSGLPRLSCIKHKNIFEIASGIGDLPHDSILIIHNGIIKKMLLN